MKIARSELNKPLNVFNVTKLKGHTRPYGSEFIYLHINCMGTIEKRHMLDMCECVCECFCSLTECVPSQSIFCVRFILTSFLCRCTLLIFTLATRTNPINMFVTPLTVTQLPKLPPVKWAIDRAKYACARCRNERQTSFGGDRCCFVIIRATIISYTRLMCEKFIRINWSTLLSLMICSACDICLFFFCVIRWLWCERKEYSSAKFIQTHFNEQIVEFLRQ